MTGDRSTKEGGFPQIHIEGMPVVVWKSTDRKAGEERIYTALEAALNAQGETAFGDQADWACGRMERGKPYFINHQEVHFSLSDSGALAAAAFAAGTVGLDIQMHRRHGSRRPREREEAQLVRIARRFFHAEETAYVLSEASGITERFFRIWTAKEAYVKYTGQGIDASFPTRSVIPEGVVLPDGIREPQVWTALGCRFFFIKPQTDCSLCLCTGEAAAGADEPVLIWNYPAGGQG